MEFDLKPTLKGGLIGTRPLRPKDFEALLAAHSLRQTFRLNVWFH